MAGCVQREMGHVQSKHGHFCMGSHCKGHSPDQAGCLPLQAQQDEAAGLLNVEKLLEACS